MEKIKQYKFVILGAIIIVGFTFYWYELRPLQIRKWCFVEHLSDKDTPNSGLYEQFLKEQEEPLEKQQGWNAYSKCLLQRGLDQ